MADTRANPTAEAPAPRLTSAQRKFLRGRAHPLRPLVHVGEAGLSDAVTRAVRDALHDHELIKVRLHEPPDKKAMAASLAERTGAALCGVVGHTIILYRRHPDEPQIELPA